VNREMRMAAKAGFESCESQGLSGEKVEMRNGQTHEKFEIVSADL